MKTKELTKINNLLYFTKETLSSLEPDIASKTLELNIYRWLKKGNIVSLKRGFYLNKEIFEKYKTESVFHEFVAGKLLYPSYLSLEYVLSKYGILTEATFGITALTTKIGRKYQNKLNTFVYKNIKPELFTGYESAYFLDNEYFIATKAKALFDFFYFKSASISENLKNRNLIEDLRLNLDNFSKNDFFMLKNFSLLSCSKKLSSIINNILKNAPYHL